MPRLVPIIYSPAVEVPHMSRMARGLALLIAAGCLAVFLVAIWLVPSPAGLATHTQLGLSSCSFLLLTGLPCISCGMTTSFAYFARGDLVDSAYVQPMGFVLAVLTVLVFWASSYCAVTGRPGYRALRRMNVPGMLIGLLLLSVLAWGWKIWIHARL